MNGLLFSFYILPVYWIAVLAVWFMVLLSMVSAVDYFIAFWSRIDRKSEKRRRRTFVLSRRRKSDAQVV
jgi:CDP-diacylglycerol--glycerol-3-phosphate 3-phosphatidyltransferase